MGAVAPQPLSRLEPRGAGSLPRSHVEKCAGLREGPRSSIKVCTTQLSLERSNREGWELSNHNPDSRVHQLAACVPPS